MAYRLFYFVLSYSLQIIYAQNNLVPNGDFEVYTQLPDDVDQVDRCVGWSKAYYTTPDYFNSQSTINSQSICSVKLPNNCIAFVNAYSGSAIAGFAAGEFITSKLNALMKKTFKYNISFWITNGFYNYLCPYSSNYLGVEFSKNSKSKDVLIPYHTQPQLKFKNQIWDTLWTKYEFTFIADSSYQYLTLGQFYNNLSYMIKKSNYSPTLVDTIPCSYYFIDKVEIILAKGTEYQQNLNLCKGEKLLLKGKNASTYQWALAANPDSIIATDSVLRVSPKQNTSYLVYGSDTTVTYFDISVVDRDSNKIGMPQLPNLHACTELSLKLYPKTPIGGDSATWELSNGTKFQQDSLHLNDTLTYSYADTGTYKVRLIRHFKCINDTAEVDLKVRPRPNITLSPDTAYYCEGGESRSIVASSVEGTSFSWSNGTLGEHLNTSDTGTYIITAKSSCGIVKDTAFVLSLKQFIPNVITPNGDGLNDQFVIKSNETPLGKLQVYNRWGATVYHSENYDNRWTGEGAGVYYYSYENLGCKVKGWLEVR